MTGLIVVDESGDLGSNGSRFFSMAALVMFRSRYLKNASKMIPNDEEEHKWSNTEPEKRKALFEVMNQCNFDAVYSVVERETPNRKTQYMATFCMKTRCAKYCQMLSVSFHVKISILSSIVVLSSLSINLGRLLSKYQSIMG